MWINPRGGDWDTPSNWSTGLIPGPGDSALIPIAAITVTHNLTSHDTVESLTSKAAIALSAGTLTLNGPSSIANALTIAGGELSGAGTLDVNSLVWSVGTMSGTGSTTVVAGGSMNLRANGSRLLDGRTLNNAGAATWSGAGNISMADGAVLDNLAGATFQVSGNASVVSGGGAAASFVNAGSFRKTTLAGTTTIAVPFVNTGAYIIDVGSLLFTSNGRVAGTTAIAAGASAVFSGDAVSLLSGSKVTGPGALNITKQATITVPGAASVSNITMDSGLITGAGALTVTGAMSWTGGTMSGPGSTVILGELAISGVQQYLSQRTLDIVGTATIADPYSSQGIYVSDGGALVIEAGGSFTFLSDCVFYAYGGTPAGGTIVNRGIFAKTGGNGTSTISTSYGYFPQNLTFTQTSTGKVQVSSGELAFNGGGSIDGKLSATGGATLGFSGGTFAILASSSFSGAGNSEFSGGTVNEAGKYAITGNTAIDGGTVNFNGDSQTGSAALSRGALSGTSALTVTGAMSWTGGSMSGPGSTVILGELTISGVQQYLSQRTLDIAGMATIADQYSTQGIYVSDGGSLVIEAGGSFTFLSDCVFYAYGGTPAGGTIVNRGIFAKTGGNGTSTISTSYGYFPQNLTFTQTSTGKVQVSSGELAFNGGGSIDGKLSATGGATLGFSGGTFAILASSSFSGAGNSEFSGGTVNEAGTFAITGGTVIDGGTVNFNGDSQTGSAMLSRGALSGTAALRVTGAMSWTGGTMSGPGSTVILGELAISGIQQYLSQRTLDIAGTATIADQYASQGIYVSDGGSLVIEAGGAFTFLSDCVFYAYGGTPAGGTIVNRGTFAKTGGTGTSTISTSYGYFPQNLTFTQTSTGKVQVSSGELAFNGGGSIDGSLSVSAAGTLGFSGGTFAILSSLEFLGSGQ